MNRLRQDCSEALGMSLVMPVMVLFSAIIKEARKEDVPDAEIKKVVEWGLPIFQISDNLH